MNIDIQTIRILDLIDRFGSMSKAAIVMGRVPSALSHAISKAEKQLNIALVKPDGRTVGLTPTGLAMLNDGRELLHGLEKLEKKIAQIESGMAEELIIGIDMNLPINNLLKWVGQFTESDAKALVSVVQKSSEALVRDLEDRKVHLIFGANMDRQTPARNITTRALMSSPQGIIIAAHHPLAPTLQKILTEAEQKNHASPANAWQGALSADIWHEINWITLADDTPYTYPVELRPNIRRTITVPDRRAQWQALQLGLGLAFIPKKPKSLWENPILQKQPMAAAHNESTPEIIAALGKQGLICLLEKPSWQISFQAAWNNQRTDPSLRWFVRQLDNIHLRTTLFD